MKDCKKCLVNKSESEFYQNKRGYYRSWCKDCDKQAAKDWRKANPQRAKLSKSNWYKTPKGLAYSRARYHKDPTKHRNSQLKKKFNITLDEYNQMFADQNGNCAICNRNRSEFERDFAVDHNHENGKVRGLLCPTCNTGLGNLQDSLLILENAIQYLKKFQL